MRTAGKTRGSGPLPSRTALPALPGRPRRAGSGQPRRAIRRDPQHGDRSLRSPRRPAPGQRSGRLAQVTPSFPLTYRAMFETRQNLAPRRGGHIFALSVLVLLAMCCVPVFAQASSAGYQYSDAPPTVTGGTPPSESNLSGGSNSTSGVGAHSGNADSSGAKSSGGGVNGSHSKSNGGSAGGESGSGQQGNQANGSQKSPAEAAKANSSSPEPGSSDGGSSPLVPILIAIVLLAGGSIGYVLMKRRRQQKTPGSSDSSDSPDAAGSSGSSVSPEAS